MSSLRTALKSESFPSVDPWVGWALTILCLLLGLLFVFGVLRINVGPLSSWIWIQILVAQVLTALAVGGAARLSSRKRAMPNNESASDAAEGQTSA
jgi:hypothetical protein